MIIRSEENKNIDITLVKNRLLKSLRTICNQFFSCYDRNALAREGPLGDPTAIPSNCLQSKPVNIKEASFK